MIFLDFDMSVAVSMPTDQHNTLIPLSADDVAKALQALLAHGWGELRVVVQDGYIATVHQAHTWRGVKPKD